MGKLQLAISRGEYKPELLREAGRVARGVAWCHLPRWLCPEEGRGCRRGSRYGSHGKRLVREISRFYFPDREFSVAERSVGSHNFPNGNFASVYPWLRFPLPKP